MIHQIFQISLTWSEIKSKHFKVKQKYFQWLNHWPTFQGDSKCWLSRSNILICIRQSYMPPSPQQNALRNAHQKLNKHVRNPHANALHGKLWWLRPSWTTLCTYGHLFVLFSWSIPDARLATVECFFYYSRRYTERHAESWNPSASRFVGQHFRKEAKSYAPLLGFMNFRKFSEFFL